jgi:hypothetical protein
MKHQLVLGLIVLFSTIIFSQPSFAGQDRCARLKSGQAAFFQHSKYRGACVVRNVGRYSNSRSIGIGNDKISSIKVGSRTKVRLCYDSKFRGRCRTYTKSTPSLGRMNDKTSSAIISRVKKSSPNSGTNNLANTKVKSKSRSSLSRSFNRVSKSRINRITVGNRGKLNVSQVLRRTNYIGCSGTLCICTGDRDCNDLFSGQCKSPSSGGSCAGSGSGTICYCTPRVTLGN